jgi:hypothetical protein
MKKKVLIIGAAAVATTLVGGWVLAQSLRPAFGPPFMQGVGPGGMGPGMMQHMMQHMGPGMGPAMMQRMHGAMGPGMAHGGPGLAFADPAQVDKLKGEIGITPAQEAAWTKYTKAVQDAAVTMKTTREGIDPAMVSKMTPRDRFAFATKMREQGQKQFEAVKTAVNELLAALDDGQKAKAKETLPGLAFGPGPMRGAFMGGPFHRQ